LWKDAKHPGGIWADLIGQDLASLKNAAVAELGARLTSTEDNVGTMGPAQRALMALTGVAHATNPPLMLSENSLTRTGRGGRGAVSKADPIALLMAMVRDLDGIERCAAIIEASVRAQPIIPIDPITKEEMTEEWLRRKYITESKGKGPGDVGPTKLTPEQ